MSQPPTTGPHTPGGSAPVEPPRKKRPAWLVPLIAGVVVLLLLLLLLSQCAGGDDADTEDAAGAGAGAGATSSATTPAPTTSDTATATTGEPSPGPTTPAAPSSTPSATPSTPAASPSTGIDGAGATGADATLVTGEGTSVLALAADTSDAGLASVEGQDATAAGVAVESVPADEGFWVGTGDQRVWAQLDGPGESDFTVEAGQQLDFTAQVVPNDDAFLQTVGLTADEGADQLQAQGEHLLVDRTTLALAG